MKPVTLLSILATLIIVVFVVYSSVKVKNNKQITRHVVAIDSLNTAISAMEVHSSVVPGDARYNKELFYKKSDLNNKISSLKAVTAPATIAGDTTQKTFWVKVAFSGVFCLAALFVVLSAKYDAETKKWAFSVLTLIAGVWIGTI